MDAPQFHPTLSITVRVPVRNLDVIAVDNSQIFDGANTSDMLKHVLLGECDNFADVG
jgi:hypothetical protein